MAKERGCKEVAALLGSKVGVSLMHLWFLLYLLFVENFQACFINYLYKLIKVVFLFSCGCIWDVTCISQIFFLIRIYSFV